MKAFYNDIEKQAIKKDYLIVDYLDQKGYEPVKKLKIGEWLYKSMDSNETTPSFYVNVHKNVYTDYSGNNSNTGEKGDIIRLVMYLENIPNFVDACNAIVHSNFKRTVIADYETTDTEDKKSIEILNVRPICRWALINYIESRKISFKLADRYCKEIDYTNKGQKYFSIGFPNDQGGFALRSAICKNQTAPQGISTLKGVESDTINVFEGFFDMLSVLQDFGYDCYKNTTYVLNSTGNLNKLIPQIPDAVTKINVFFDNDEGGRKAVEKLSKYHWQIFDKSDLYEGYNDYNEYLMNKKIVL
ncbi:toprim domain-containing protein [Emticicia fontis]